MQGDVITAGQLWVEDSFNSSWVRAFCIVNLKEPGVTSYICYVKQTSTPIVVYFTPKPLKFAPIH